MKTADFGNLHDRAHFRPLDGPPIRRILLERKVSSRPVIVQEVAGQDAAEVSLAEDEHVIQALAPDRTDEPLREGVLPRAGGRGQDFPDTHTLHALPERGTVGVVTIAQEIGRRGVVGEGVHDLLGRPVRGRVFGHVEVDDAPSMVGEHDEHKEHPHARGGHREEIEGHQVPDVVGEERAPGLRRGCAPLRHQLGNGSLGHLDAELPEFAMDSRGAPQGIHRRHFSDEAHPRAAGEPRPVLTEATALPPQDSVGRHDDQILPPAGPDSGQPNPQEAIHRAQSGPRHRSFVHGELLTQGEVLQGELAVAAAEEREESNQVEHEGDHQARILSGSELIDQPLAHRIEFWRRTGRAKRPSSPIRATP
jgi:hypothetical protein